MVFYPFSVSLHTTGLAEPLYSDLLAGVPVLEIKAVVSETFLNVIGINHCSVN